MYLTSLHLILFFFLNGGRLGQVLQHHNQDKPSGKKITSLQYYFYSTWKPSIFQGYFEKCQSLVSLEECESMKFCRTNFQIMQSKFKRNKLQSIRLDLTNMYFRNSRPQYGFTLTIICSVHFILHLLVQDEWYLSFMLVSITLSM